MRSTMLVLVGLVACGGSSEDPTCVIDVWFPDEDGDGYGDSKRGTEICGGSAGFVSRGGDCDDDDRKVHPGRAERCNEIDDDCDGEVDESGASGEVFYRDADGDGWGTAEDQLEACAEPEGYVSRDGDCDDAEITVHPLAAETWYDGIDQDCDGDSDYDADGDGHDSDQHGGDDCDDTVRSVHPGATDVPYDGIDADCAGDSDNDADGDTYDSDQHGGTDCDDSDATVFPGAADTWYDGIDGDCAGDSDYDYDRDGSDSDLYGGTDCDDADPGIGPHATEVCDALDFDEDCDGLADDADPDVDTSTFVSFFEDADQDGHGAPGTSVMACDVATGRSLVDTDCDDANWSVNPDRTEVCGDGIDNDCDGLPTTSCSGISRMGIWEGVAGGDRLGVAISEARDHDGDGVLEVALGAPTEATGAFAAGSVYLVDPAVGGGSVANNTAWIQGGARDGRFGAALAWVDDATGDSLDELAVGAPQDSAAAQYGGAVHLFDGPLVGTLQGSAARAVWTGEAAFDLAGSWIGAGSDLTGDGVPDLVIGAPGANGGDGAVYVVDPSLPGGSLATATVVLTGEAGSAAGFSGAIGDWDGDGQDDLLIGAPGDSAAGADAGNAYLVHGPVSSGSLAGAALRIRGGAAGDLFGTAVAFDPETGTPYVSAPGALEYWTQNPYGLIAWFSNPALIGEVDAMTGSLEYGPGGSGFGTAFALYDITNDGTLDYLVGSPDAGRFDLYEGPTFRTPDYSFRNTGGLGVSVQPLGDSDGDGYLELLLGRPLGGAAGAYTGEVWWVEQTNGL